MNNKEKELYRIVDNVIQCCSSTIDEDGTQSVQRGDVLGKSRSQNVVMTRCILVSQIVSAGYSIATVSKLLNRSAPCIRHMVEMGFQFQKTSRAYRIANAEATLLCRDAI